MNEEGWVMMAFFDGDFKEKEQIQKKEQNFKIHK